MYSDEVPAEDDQNLTPEELAILKEDGMLPEKWEPGTPDKSDLVAPTGPLEAVAPGVMVEGSGQDGPLSTVTSPIQSGIDLLGQYDKAAPSMTNPLAQKFHELAVSWLPTNDNDLKAAKVNAQKAADELASLRSAAQTKSGQFPYNEFGAALLAGGYGSFPQKYGQALMSAQEVQRGNLKTAQELGLKEAEGTAAAANQAENSVYKRMDAAAAMERAAATMQHFSGALAKAPTSEIGRAATAMGYDVNTPPGQMAARRLYTLQHGTPEMKEAIANTPPTVDPSSPEFQEAVGAVFQRKGSKVDLESDKIKQQIEASKQAGLASQQSVAASQLSMQDTRLKMEKLRQDVAAGKTNVQPDHDLAAQIGVPVAQTNPYAQSDTRGQNALLTRETTNFQKRTTELGKMVDENQQHVTDVQNMVNLLDKGFQTGTQYLGGDYGNPLKYLNSDARAFDAAASRTVNLSKPQGMTRVTNYEEKLIKQGAISLDKPTDVNRQALAAAQVMFRLQPMKQQSLQDYFDVNHHLGGFDKHWDDYIRQTFYPDGKTFHTPQDPNSFPDFHEWWVTTGSQGGGKKVSTTPDPLGIR